MAERNDNVLDGDKVEVNNAVMDEDAIAADLKDKHPEFFGDEPEDNTDDQAGAGVNDDTGTNTDDEPVVDGTETTENGQADQKVATAKVAKDEEALTAIEIPDQHIKALIASDWAESEILEAHDTFPEKLANIAKSTYDTQFQQATALAQVGETMIKVNAKSQQAVTGDEEETAKPMSLNMEEIKEKYQDDSGIIDNVVGPMNEILGRLNTELTELRGAVTTETNSKLGAAKHAEQQAIAQQIDGFCTSKEVAGYEDLYGESGDASKITPEQVANRLEIANVAAKLGTGHYYQTNGEQLPLDDALKMAHVLISAPLVQKALVSKIKSGLKSRANNISLPANRTGASQAKDEIKAKKSVNGNPTRVRQLMKKIGM